MLTTVCNVILACKHLWQLWRGAPATMGCPAVPHLRLTRKLYLLMLCVCDPAAAVPPAVPVQGRPFQPAAGCEQGLQR